MTRELPDAVMDRMEQLFHTTIHRGPAALTRDELAAAMAECDVLVPTVTDEIDAGLIASAGPALKLIANFGAGVNHIDLKAARARGIIVTNTPRRTDRGHRRHDDGVDPVGAAPPGRGREAGAVRRMEGLDAGGMLGHRIGGKALGILGMGRIGQAVARRARAFGLTIHYHNRLRLPKVVEAELQAQWHPNLDEMLSTIDILTIHTPRNPDSEGLIDAGRIALLRPHVYVINTSRGGIVDEGALIVALEGGRLAGAGLDVWQHEPQIDPRLLALPNVVMTPHMGSATFEGRLATGEKVIANIRMWADGHRPPDQVLEGWA
ncbi:2-hydroxyacid dehydrogenase [Sphingomonas sp. Ant H11]|uniref:2-hydroxyacid dehydrogenase n=1 Tax=Sphingomonas sp. Ant H11 TaxID=1564113 RepID=UPI000A44397A|nr:NAD(P)-dependent oxidoreductase [Sphingomonas sp. Ant H11]